MTILDIARPSTCSEATKPFSYPRWCENQLRNLLQPRVSTAVCITVHFLKNQLQRQSRSFSSHFLIKYRSQSGHRNVFRHKFLSGKIEYFGIIGKDRKAGIHLPQFASYINHGSTYLLNADNILLERFSVYHHRQEQKNLRSKLIFLLLSSSAYLIRVITPLLNHLVSAVSEPAPSSTNN